MHLRVLLASRRTVVYAKNLLAVIARQVEEDDRFHVLDLHRVLVLVMREL